AWKLASFHLDGLTTEECLWLPAHKGLHVHQVSDGRWRADWPDHEGYDVGPPSIAWLTWHIGFWWSMAIDHSFGDGSLRSEEHTSELQSRFDLVCRLLLEKKNAINVEALGRDDHAFLSPSA